MLSCPHHRSVAKTISTQNAQDKGLKEDARKKEKKGKVWNQIEKKKTKQKKKQVHAHIFFSTMTPHRDLSLVPIFDST